MPKQNEEHQKHLEQVLAILSRGGSHQAVDVGKDFAEVFHSEGEQVSTENETAEAAATVEDVAVLPGTPAEIEEWYYDVLTEYERCFVEALAVLYGAPPEDISDAARQLYKADLKKRDDLPALRRRDLLKHVCATIRRINLVDRTFWQNKNVQAQQDFTLRLLRFLADEKALSLQNERFSDTLCTWAETLPGECSRKAAYAAGVLLYYQNADELWRTANAWADSDKAKERHLAASLLNGAYDVDKMENPELADNTQKSPVFRLLNQWVGRAENARNQRVGSAAANTYRLMGRKIPDIALAGLESLLCFPESQASKDWERIAAGVWVECISDYVGIAWSGRIGKVLDHLARYARMLVNRQQRPTHVDQREAYDHRREINLVAVLDIFFFTALSFLDIREDAQVTYNFTDPLPEFPPLPDPQGRDILLVGILSSQEPRWRGNLLVLLCAAIFAGREREAFFFLGQWVDNINRLSEEQRAEASEIYMQFLFALGGITHTWEEDMKARNLRTRPAYEIFLRQINLLKGQDSRKPLIEQVLNTLLT